ncbi:MAG: DUF1109 domain-containing protein [Rhizomicrobium sp.]
MKTDELIDRLSGELAPVSRAAVPATLAVGLGAGALVSFAAMWLWLGIRPDLASAAATSAYWMKFFYTLSLGCFAFWAVERLARPGASSRVQMTLLAVPLVILLVLAFVQIDGVSRAMRMHMMMGASSNVCPWRIAILSLPVFAGAFWALGKLAPTRLIVAGTMAGLLAGAFGAWVYAFHCDESAAPFVVIWYTLGIAAIGALGGVLGRYVLRW